MFYRHNRRTHLYIPASESERSAVIAPKASGAPEDDEETTVSIASPRQRIRDALASAKEAALTKVSNYFDVDNRQRVLSIRKEEIVEDLRYRYYDVTNQAWRRVRESNGQQRACAAAAVVVGVVAAWRLRRK